MASSRVSSPEDAEAATKHISDLVDGIPLDLLAQAASQCGAHARALQYYESYVRTKRGGALNPAAKKSATYDDAEVTFLQVPSTTRAQTLDNIKSKDCSSLPQ